MTESTQPTLAVTKRCHAYSALSVASFVLGTYSVMVVLVQAIMAVSMGVSGLSEVVSSELENDLLGVSTFSAIAAAGMALVLGAFAMVRFRRTSRLAMIGTSFGLALVAWVLVRLILPVG